MGHEHISASSQDAATVSREFASAHEALRADTSIQFNFTPPDPPARAPSWLRHFMEWLGETLRPVGRAIKWLGHFLPDAPWARFLLWTVLAVAAAALIAILYRRLRDGQWHLPWRKRNELTAMIPDEDEWRPQAVPVRSWLEEADALAAQGRFADAVHHLLLRSIEDIARRRPRLVRPALTSRELAASDAIPSAARDLFAAIARLVERSLFGGRDVPRRDWESARAAYADFALAGAWNA